MARPECRIQQVRSLETWLFGGDYVCGLRSRIPRWSFWIELLLALVVWMSKSQRRYATGYVDCKLRVCVWLSAPADSRPLGLEFFKSNVFIQIFSSALLYYLLLPCGFYGWCTLHRFYWLTFVLRSTFCSSMNITISDIYKWRLFGLHNCLSLETSVISYERKWRSVQINPVVGMTCWTVRRLIKSSEAIQCPD